MRTELAGSTEVSNFRASQQRNAPLGSCNCITKVIPICAIDKTNLDLTESCSFTSEVGTHGIKVGSGNSMNSIRSIHGLAHAGARGAHGKCPSNRYMYSIGGGRLHI